MKVVWTEAALHDLEDITAFVLVHYPGIASAFERRVQLVIAQLLRWPRSARRAAGRPGVRLVPLARYPYRVFYCIDGEEVQILHIHHAARDED